MNIDMSSGKGSGGEVGLEPTGQPSFPGLERLIGQMLGEKQPAQKVPSGEPLNIEMGE